MPVCAKCGNSFNGKFCPNCGTKWEERHCPNCGAVIDNDIRYCPECGTEVNKPAKPKGSLLHTITGGDCCRNCAYYDKTESPLFHDALCLYLNKGVNGDGSCDHYATRANKSNSGYKSNFCFLTSAYVEHLGKADDCEELTALRAFRDGYMAKTDEGKALVAEYYEVAPKIVEFIDSSSDKDKYYDYIGTVVNRCITLINDEKNEQAQDEYKAMVLKLKAAADIK
ncbi:MAG: zinc ribbon domain-containing protein [Clostridiales bacterium]|nr:zinc ribbon domain-containing protein [Clostridiales bacterium]